MWEFFCNENADLCYRTDGKESVLQSGVYEDFDIITDSNGYFHLTVQDCSGSLIYLTYDHSQWRKFVVLNSKSPKSRMSGFKLFLIHGELRCFYILDIGKTPMLIHHRFSLSAQSETPGAISYTDSSKSFSCCADAKGNIHIFFFNEEGVMCYKIYKAESLEYEDGVLHVEDEIKNICPIYSKNYGLNFLYTAKIKSYYALIFYSAEKKERKIITFSDSNATDICLVTSDSSIFIQWRERARFYQCSSADGGATFKKPSPISEAKGRRAMCVKMRMAANPFNFGCDCCVALYNGKEAEVLNIEQLLGSENKAIPQKNQQKNHKSEKNDYNVIDGKTDDELKYIHSKINEIEKELIRLNTIVNTLSDKISCLTKSQFRDQAVSSVSKVSATDKDFKNDVGTIDEDNYRIFQSTEAESLDFENSKKF